MHDEPVAEIPALPRALLVSPFLNNLHSTTSPQDPWTPPKRVLALEKFGSVERVIPLSNVGHCPMDESPTTVNPIIVDFVKAVSSSDKSE